MNETHADPGAGFGDDEFESAGSERDDDAMRVAIEAAAPDFADRPNLADSALRRLRRRRANAAVGGSVAVVTAVAVGGLAVAPERDGSGSARPVTAVATTAADPNTGVGGGQPPRGTATPPGQEFSVPNAAADLERYLLAHYQTGIMSVVGIGPTDTLIVYRVPVPGLDDAARAHAAPHHVRFVDAALNASQQWVLGDRIRKDIASGYWKARNVLINGEAEQNDGRITIYDYAPDQDTAALQAAYGAANITVVQAF